MSSRTANWIIGPGVFLMFAGLGCLPAAFGQHPDADLLALGASFFSLGALTVSAGFYVKGRFLQVANEAGTATKKETANSNRRIRGGCDLCATEAPVIQCRVHKLQLCGSCLGNHYDPRSCVYSPSTRNATPFGKAASAKASASLR